MFIGFLINRLMTYPRPGRGFRNNLSTAGAWRRIVAGPRWSSGAAATGFGRAPTIGQSVAVDGRLHRAPTPFRLSYASWLASNEGEEPWPNIHTASCDSPMRCFGRP